MSTLKTHNLQSPDAGSVNITLAPNAGMVVAGLSTYSNQINVGSNIKIGNAGVVTATSFSGDGSNLTGVSGVSVANQANNRLITATSTTDALYGESTLTYDGTNFLNSSGGKFQIGNDSLPVAQSQILHIRNNNHASQYFRNETTKSDHSYLAISLKAPNLDFQIWNQGSAGGGYGGANSVNFYQAAGSPGPYGFYFNTTQALRINANGNIVMGNSTTSTTRLDIRFTDTTTYSATSNHVNGLKIFNDSNTDNGFAGIELAATDGDDYYGSTLLKSIADGTNYTNDFVIQTRIGGNYAERLRINSSGNFGFGMSPSDYALATFNSANGIQLQGDGQSRILMRNNTGGTNQKMMDIQCDGNINFRTINDNYTTATTRATFRTDGNFVVGNRVGTNAPSTNQPVAFHSARITPDGMTSTVSNGVRCNLYVGSNEGWAAGDGGVIGMGGSRSGSAGQEAIWSYIKGSRQSGNGWEYAGKMELGTTEWGTYNMTKAVTIFADNQFRLHGDDNSMMTFDIGGALRLIIEHTGGGNMRLRNLSSGTVTYSTSSDYRLKENATTINNALTTIKSLKPYQFTWKHDNKLGQGFFAHEAQAVLPDVGIVSGAKDEVHLEDDTKHDGQWKKDDPIYQSVDYSKLVPLLTAALQEETAKREALEARVAALEGS